MSRGNPERERVARVTTATKIKGRRFEYNTVNRLGQSARTRGLTEGHAKVVANLLHPIRKVIG